MADEYKKALASWWIFILALNFVSKGFVEGRNTSIEIKFGPKPKRTIKTIEALEYGDVIDCIDIYKQPAFEDPRIRVEDLKMKPKTMPAGMFKKSENVGARYVTKQNWQRYGECPKGTVPIRRTLTDDIHRRKYSTNEAKHEYAAISTQPYGHYYGATGGINIWKPKVENKNEFSLSQIWVVADIEPALKNTIEAGWVVYPSRYKDDRPRFFVHWTADGYKKTGCWDLDCSGFVSINNKFAPGASMLTSSTYDGEQMELILYIHKDDENKRWWLLSHDKIYLGYWPFSIFTYLASHASRITWGGEIVNLGRYSHTSTQMGNGHFPAEGYTKAAYIRKLEVYNSSTVLVDVKDLIESATDPDCYDEKITILDKQVLFFGGPGQSRLCK